MFDRLSVLFEEESMKILISSHAAFKRRLHTEMLKLALINYLEVYK